MRAGMKKSLIVTLVAAVGFIALSNLSFLGASGSSTGVGASPASKALWIMGMLSAVAFLIIGAVALVSRRSGDREVNQTR